MSENKREKKRRRKKKLNIQTYSHKLYDISLSVISQMNIKILNSHAYIPSIIRCVFFSSSNNHDLNLKYKLT